MINLKNASSKVKNLIKEYGGLNAVLSSLRAFHKAINDTLGAVVAIVMTLLLALAVIIIAILI